MNENYNLNTPNNKMQRDWYTQKERQRYLSTRYAFFMGLILLVSAITILLVIKHYKAEIKKEVVMVHPLTVEKCDSIKSIITLYHSNIKECGSNKNIGYFGDTMKLGYCAASQGMFNKYVNYNDTIIIPSGSLKGEYVVKDHAGSKGMLIDVWKPLTDKSSGCYNCKIVVK